MCTFVVTSLYSIVYVPRRASDSRSIRFGDISAQTEGARIFLTIYMLVATFIVAITLGDIMALFVDGYVGEEIIVKIIGSVSWVHRSDLYNTGRITEPDYGRPCLKNNIYYLLMLR